MKTYAILLINSSEENYRYINDCLKKTQFAQFKVDWLRHDNSDINFFQHNQFSHHIYLIDSQAAVLTELIQKTFLHPVIILKTETASPDNTLETSGFLQLYYHQINPIVLEHFLQLSLYLNHQNQQIIVQFEQSNALLEKEINATRSIITDINQYLLEKIDQQFIYNQLHTSGFSKESASKSGNNINTVGIIRNNLAGNCVYCNHFLLQLFETEEEHILGNRWLGLVHQQDRERVASAWEAAHKNRSPLMLKYRLTKPEGSLIWIYTQLVFEDDAQGNRIGSVATMSEITDNQATQQRLQREIVAKQEVAQAVKSANQQLQQLVNLDRVTQLANRFSFDGYFQREWQRAEQKQMPISLLLVDIDHFHQFNRLYGYSQGDNCLQVIAKALKALLKRPRDLLTRYGNDEFAVLLPDTPLEGATVVASHILAEVQKLQIIHHPQYSDHWVSVSIGIAHLIPTVSLTPEKLLHFAEIALRQAKIKGGNQWQTESLDMNPLMEENSVNIDWDSL